MLKRTLTGLCLIALIVGFMAGGYFVSPIFVDMLIYVFLLGAVVEMYNCLKNAGFKTFSVPVAFVMVAGYPVYYCLARFVGWGTGLQGLLAVLLAGMTIVLTIFTFKPAKVEGVEDSKACDLKDLFANVFILIYPVAFMALAWNLSFKYSGFFAILFAALVPVMGSDMFAYFFGASYSAICKKHGVEPKRLCPKISPKKTVVGGIGGVFGGMLVAILFWLLFEYFAVFPSSGYAPFISHAVDGWEWKTALIYLALGAICGVISELGDLAASRIKRAMGIKDYGKIFPGHGGFMDRIDSVMYCLVILTIAFTAIYGF